MPSTYTGNNTLTLQAFNENPNSWGSILNTVLELVDSSLDGIEAVDVAGSAPTATLTIADGASAQARSRVLNFTGARTVTNITVTIGPNTAEKIYWVRNSTTGGFSVILAQGSGSTVTIAPGAWALVFLDGAGSGAGVTTLTSFAMAGSSSGITILQPSAVASGTLTLPAATDTLVGRATTDTLSNKTLATPTITTNATVPLVIGGTGTTSTLSLRSTSGAGTTGADIVFQTGTNGSTEAMRISNSGSSNFGKIWTAGLQATGNATLSRGDLVAFGTSSDGAALTWDVQTNAGNASVMARLRPRWRANLGYALDVFAGSWNNAYDPGSAVATFESVGNLKIGGTADRATTAGTNQVVIFNGTAPVGTLANGASFYATSGEMRVMDASGNATLLSPHDAETNEWIYDSTHTPTGKRLKISVEKLLRFVNDHFGLDCVMEEE
ncbi:MAG: hypothetical protein INH43_18785 [Acidobacteriaceae bacterium]|nr:hypothetical protein [Acidobacteriaceae bacterium]